MKPNLEPRHVASQLLSLLYSAGVPNAQVGYSPVYRLEGVLGTLGTQEVLCGGVYRFTFRLREPDKNLMTRVEGLPGVALQSVEPEESFIVVWGSYFPIGG